MAFIAPNGDLISQVSITSPHKISSKALQGSYRISCKDDAQVEFVTREISIHEDPQMVALYLQLEIPFLLNNLGDTAAMVTTIKQVRDICDNFQTRGLPNFPQGIPFTFWEQYIGLRFYLLLSLAAAITAVFLVISILLMSPWSAALIIFIVSSIVGQLFGALGIFGIKLSAVPAVILILAVGIGVEFTLHILLSFVGSLGDRSKRTVLALEHMFAPVMHGAFSTFLGVVMLAFSQFDFIFR